MALAPAPTGPVAGGWVDSWFWESPHSDKEKAPKRWVLPFVPLSVCHGWWGRRGLEEAEKKEQLGEGSHFRKQQ